MGAARNNTQRLMVGSVPLGAGATIAVQSMLTTSTQEVEECLTQIEALKNAGCHIIRVAVESKRDLEPFSAICAESSLPVVADIHFDYRLAVGAAQRGAAKLRINPGNIGSYDKVDAVIEAAGEAGIPIRIGVNSGSLEEEIKTRTDISLAEKMTLSAERFVEHFYTRGFKKIVLSAKASDVPTTIDAYKRLSALLPQIPLHLGVTEAGTVEQGSIRSAVGIGTLLALGIGDTLRVSLTADPRKEIEVANSILTSLELKTPSHPTLISCPTCSRCKVDLFAMAGEVEQRLKHIPAPLKVAVMGCVVNGPGEAEDADFGVACGRGTGALFAQGQVLYTVEESKILDALFEEIDKSLS